MNMIKTKTAILVIILLLVCLFATCEFTKQVQSTNQFTPTDTLFMNQWRREKAEKQKLVLDYEFKIRNLQTSKDSLSKDVSLKKQSIASLRFKVNFIEDRLKQKILNSDTINKQEIRNDLDSLFLSQNKSDTLCDQTISTLEKIIGNRDSTISFHQQIESNLRSVQKNQELNTEFLTGQLNDANKALRKKFQQNRWLAGGLLVLSGISTSFFITQHLK